MDLDINRIEFNVTQILKATTKMCLNRQTGLTNFKYKHTGEVFGLPNDCNVHVLPGYEEWIMIVRGASLVSLNRSHAEPIRTNMLWTLTVRRNPTGQAIPATKGFVITDDTISKLPAIAQKQASNLNQVAATDLMDTYCEFRGRWKRKTEMETAARMVNSDLEGICPIEPAPENDYKQKRPSGKDVDVPRELDM